MTTNKNPDGVDRRVGIGVSGVGQGDGQYFGEHGYLQHRGAGGRGYQRRNHVSERQRRRNECNYPRRGDREYNSQERDDRRFQCDHERGDDCEKRRYNVRIGDYSTEKHKYEDLVRGARVEPPRERERGAYHDPPRDRGAHDHHDDEPRMRTASSTMTSYQERPLALDAMNKEGHPQLHREDKRGRERDNHGRGTSIRRDSYGARHDQECFRSQEPRLVNHRFPADYKEPFPRDHTQPVAHIVLEKHLDPPDRHVITNHQRLHSVPRYASPEAARPEQYRHEQGRPEHGHPKQGHPEQNREERNSDGEKCEGRPNYYCGECHVQYPSRHERRVQSYEESRDHPFPSLLQDELSMQNSFEKQGSPCSIPERNSDHSAGPEHSNPNIADTEEMVITHDMELPTHGIELVGCKPNTEVSTKPSTELANQPELNTTDHIENANQPKIENVGPDQEGLVCYIQNVGHAYSPLVLMAFLLGNDLLMQDTEWKGLLLKHCCNGDESHYNTLIQQCNQWSADVHGRILNGNPIFRLNRAVFDHVSKRKLTRSFPNHNDRTRLDRNAVGADRNPVRIDRKPVGTDRSADGFDQSVAGTQEKDTTEKVLDISKNVASPSKELANNVELSPSKLSSKLPAVEEQICLMNSHRNIPNGDEVASHDMTSTNISESDGYITTRSQSVASTLRDSKDPKSQSVEEGSNKEELSERPIAVDASKILTGPWLVFKDETYGAELPSSVYSGSPYSISPYVGYGSDDLEPKFESKSNWKLLKEARYIFPHSAVSVRIHPIVQRVICFFTLPKNRSTRRALGYCFLCFRHRPMLDRFVELMQGVRITYDMSRSLAISFARMKNLEELKKNFQYGSRTTPNVHVFWFDETQKEINAVIARNKALWGSNTSRLNNFNANTSLSYLGGHNGGNDSASVKAKKMGAPHGPRDDDSRYGTQDYNPYERQGDGPQGDTHLDYTPYRHDGYAPEENSRCEGDAYRQGHSHCDGVATTRRYGYGEGEFRYAKSYNINDPRKNVIKYLREDDCHKSQKPSKKDDLRYNGMGINFLKNNFQNADGSYKFYNSHKNNQYCNQKYYYNRRRSERRFQDYDSSSQQCFTIKTGEDQWNNDPYDLNGNVGNVDIPYRNMNSGNFRRHSHVNGSYVAPSRTSNINVGQYSTVKGEKYCANTTIQHNEEKTKCNGDRLSYSSNKHQYDCNTQTADSVYQYAAVKFHQPQFYNYCKGPREYNGAKQNEIQCIRGTRANHNKHSNNSDAHQNQVNSSISSAYDYKRQIGAMRTLGSLRDASGQSLDCVSPENQRLKVDRSPDYHSTPQIIRSVPQISPPSRQLFGQVDARNYTQGTGGQNNGGAYDYYVINGNYAQNRADLNGTHGDHGGTQNMRSGGPHFYRGMQDYQSEHLGDSRGNGVNERNDAVQNAIQNGSNIDHTLSGPHTSLNIHDGSFLGNSKSKVTQMPPSGNRNHAPPSMHGVSPAYQSMITNSSTNRSAAVRIMNGGASSTSLMNGASLSMVKGGTHEVSSTKTDLSSEFGTQITNAGLPYETPNYIRSELGNAVGSPGDSPGDLSGFVNLLRNVLDTPSLTLLLDILKQKSLKAKGVGNRQG